MKLILLTIGLFTFNLSIAQPNIPNLLEHFGFDNSQTGDNGTNLNYDGVTFTKDLSGNSTSAIKLNPSASKYFTAELASLPQTGEEFGFAFWYKGDPTKTYSLFNYGSGAQSWFAIAQEGGKIKCSGRLNGLISTSIATDTNWHHLAVSYATDKRLSIYYDGALKTADTMSLLITGTKFNIGISPFGAVYGNFEMDDFYMYKRTLTASDVVQLFKLKPTASISQLEPVLLIPYPNPSNESFTLLNSTVGDEIRLVSLSGQLIDHVKITSEHTSVSTSNLIDGFYLINTFRNGQMIANTKIAVQH